MCSRRRVRVSVSRVEKNFERRCEIEIRARKILAGWDHVSNGFERARLFVDYLGLGENESSILRCKAFSQEVFGLSFSLTVYGQLTTWGTGHVRFWKMADTFTGLKLHASLGKFGAEPLSDVCATCESGDGKITLSGTGSGAILAWSGGLIETKFCIDEEITCHDGAINSMHLRRVMMRDEMREQQQRVQLITAGEDGYVRAWMRMKFGPLWRRRRHRSCRRSSQYSSIISGTR